MLESNKKFKISKSYIILIILAVVTFYRWISFNVFASGDWWYFPNTSMRAYIPPSIWTSLADMGNVDVIFWRLPVINIPFGIFGQFGLTQEIAEKIVLFWPSIIVGNIAMYLLANKIFKSSIPSILSTVIFNYNTYYLFSTHYLLYSAGVWGIFSFFLFTELIDKRKLLYSLLTGLSLFITSAYDLRALYIILLIFFMHFVYQLYLKQCYHKKINKDLFFYSFISLIILLILNTYWILPTINAGTLVNNQILVRPLFGNEFLNILYAITLHHPFWTGAKPAIFENQPIIWYFWLIPLAAFLGLIVNRKNPIILFYGLIALMGILLTKQVGSPFVDLYKFLFEHLPGFNAFREASKFYLLIIVGYSILIGALASWLLNNFNKNNKQKRFTSIVVMILFSLFILNIKPYLTGEIGTMYVPRTIPHEYSILNNSINADKNFYRVLWIPIFPRFASNSYNHPTLNGIDMTVTLEPLIQKEIKSNKYSSGDLLLKLLGKREIESLLDYSAVKYVIVPPQDQEDFYLDYGIKRQKYIQFLDNTSYLQKSNFKIANFDIYENKNYVSLFSISEHRLSLSESIKERKFKNVAHFFITPSEYSIILHNLKEPVYLNFSENYHPQWKIHIGNFNWVDSVITKKYFLSDDVHIKNELGYNSFFIDPNKICSYSESCKKNDNGSWDIPITFFFRPQAFFYIGSIISLICFISVAALITYKIIKKK